MFVDILVWILLISMWAAIIKYRKVVKWWTWNFVWAEHYLWRWWTYFAILLFWLWMIFYWAIYPFWWLSSVLDDSAQDERDSNRTQNEVKRDVSK